jgi:hypothetical protein
VDLIYHTFHGQSLTLDRQRGVDRRVQRGGWIVGAGGGANGNDGRDEMMMSLQTDTDTLASLELQEAMQLIWDRQRSYSLSKNDRPTYD